MNGGDLGLARREMERELAWLLRSVPADQRAFAKLLSEAFIKIMEKNNARIAEQLDHDASPDIEEDF